MPNHHREEPPKSMSLAPPLVDPLDAADFQLAEHTPEELISIWEASGGQEALDAHLADLDESVNITEEVLMAIVQG